jgi:hypothetical protein
VNPRLSLVLLLLASPARAADSSARLDLHAGAGWRDDTFKHAPVDATARGGAVLDFGLRAVLFPSAHLGAALRFDTGRFTLKPSRGVSLPERFQQSTFEVGGGLAARASHDLLTAEVHLGYGVLGLPLVFATAGPAGDLRFDGGGRRVHGPYAGIILRASAGRLGLELGGEARPWIFDARYDEVALDTRRFSGRAGVLLDCCDLGRTRWSVLAGYELSDTRAKGPGVTLGQRQHHLELGLRVRWLPPAPPPPPPPPPPAPPPPPVVRPPPPPVPGAISGVIHGEAGQPVTARISVAELGVYTRADGQGAFRFDVPPGRYTLTVEAEGYLPQTKVITVGQGEQHIYNLELQKEAR